MRRLAVIVTVATALAITVIVKGQGKTDPALKLAPEWAAAFNAKDAAKIASLYRDCSQRSCSCCGPDTTRATRLTNRCRRGSLSLSAGGGGNGGSIARTVTVVSARLFLDRACTTARPGLRPVSTP
jgi:hypothetical protein